MLPQEASRPLKKIGEKNPILELLLTLLIIGISLLVVKHFKDDKKLEERSAACEADRYRDQKHDDSVLREENKVLQKIVDQNNERKPSQDTAIKIINEAYK